MRVVKAQPRGREGDALACEQRGDAFVHGEQLRDRHPALGGGRLVGDAHQQVARVGQAGARRRRSVDETHLLDTQRRLGGAGERVGYQLVENPIAIEERGRPHGLARAVSDSQ